MKPTSGWRQHYPATIVLVMVAAVTLLLAAGVTAWAQQGQYVPPPVAPPTQSQGGGVLELPSMPGRQTGSSSTIPPIAPQTGRELELPSRQLRSQAGYEQVTVTVTNQNGSYVTGLQRKDFNLYVDGRQRSIKFFRQDLNTPVSIGIIVDTSGSMQPKLAQARAAISEFIRDLNPRDDIFLFAFSSRPFLLQPFTTNHALVMSRLALLHAYGQTALFDSIMDGLMMVRNGRYDKKALLVITDGMDNTSQTTLQQVVLQARRMGVLIYSIGIGDPNSSPGGSIAIGPFIFGGDVDEVDARTLRMLSTETGAKTFIIREVGDGAALRSACSDISHELREQYTIGFVAPDASSGGYRSLRVDVPGSPGSSVRVRKGVVVAPGTESASGGGYGP